MITKFESGEEVIVKGKKEVIKVAKKNFSSKKISYQLESGTIVEESAIKKLKGEKPGDEKINPLFKEYEEVCGKPVPNNKKKDEAWIKEKIAKAKAKAGEEEDADDEPTNAEKLAALKELDFDGLVKVAEEKELDIDPDDYEDEEELLTAICEELEIEIPEEDSE